MNAKYSGEDRTKQLPGWLKVGEPGTVALRLWAGSVTAVVVEQREAYGDYHQRNPKGPVYSGEPIPDREDRLEYSQNEGKCEREERNPADSATK